MLTPLLRDADEVLNEWSGSVKGLLGLLERIDHLITKEEGGFLRNLGISCISVDAV